MRVEQSVEIGSVQDALYFKYIDVGDVLRYLIGKPLSCRRLAAYRACCYFMHPNMHLVDNVHFLRLCSIPEYIALFLCFGGHQHMLPDLKEIDSVIERLYTDVIFQVRIQSIASITLAFFDTQQSYEDLVLNRSFPMVCGELDVISNKLLLESENLLALSVRDPDTYVVDVVERVMHLRSVASDYWQYVASDIYFNFVTATMLDPMRFTKDQLLTMSEVWTKLNRDWWKNLSEEVFKILALPAEQRTYVLGFPVHCAKISKKQVLDALKMLSEEGIDKYTDRIRLCNKRQMEYCGSFDYLSLTLVNTKDTTLTPVVDYSPSDLVLYQQEDKLYCFTRPEFEYLLEKKINPWTKDRLSDSILVEIESRQKIMSSYPDCQPIADLLLGIFGSKR